MQNNNLAKTQPNSHETSSPIDISKIDGPVYIAPAGCGSLVVYHALHRQGIEVLGFCDNDPTMAGKSYDGIFVCSPADAVEKNPKAAVVVAAIYYRKPITEQFEKLGAATVIYAGQFMNRDIFDAALDDIDESAATALTNFDDPKAVAMRTAELLCLPWSGIDIKFTRAYFSPGLYKNPYEAFRQWFDRIYDRYDAFTEVSLGVWNSSDTAEQMLDMLLYLKERLKKPTKFIRIRSFYTPENEQHLHDLENRLLGEGISVINTKAGDPLKFDLRTDDIPIITTMEDAYSDVEDMYNCIFTHIPKNAGTSIMRLLSTLHSHHKKALHCKLYDPKKFNKYFKFTVVRNPWDLLVSKYFYENKRANNQGWNSGGTTVAEKNIYIHDTFRDFLLHLTSSTAPRQHPWICDNDGNILVDYVGRFENLPETVEYIKEKLGLDPALSLPHKNASNHKPYTEYYDEEMIEIVRKLAKRDIELFGYEFGKHPGPNIIINPREDFVPVNRRVQSE